MVPQATSLKCFARQPVPRRSHVLSLAALVAADARLRQEPEEEEDEEEDEGDGNEDDDDDDNADDGYSE